ncbi:MAG TPA: HNH endonuclease signature motif containing protein [Candidatus Bathyarchaeia archaeon]|nr:HNH endonuclease signature motif containing protein [Candidatus Bathyarchaeia archaeon]
MDSGPASPSNRNTVGHAPGPVSNGPVLLDAAKAEKKKYRSRLSPQAYKIAVAFLRDRQTGKCYGTDCTEIPWQIHHRDGNTHNWNPENLRLSCQEHNPRGLVESVERKKETLWPDVNASYEVRRHVQLETDFEKTLDRLLDLGPVTVKEAENRIAKINGSTQPVVRLWIDREITPEGSFTISERQVSDGRKTRTEQYLGRKRIPQ